MSFISQGRLMPGGCGGFHNNTTIITNNYGGYGGGCGGGIFGMGFGGGMPMYGMGMGGCGCGGGMYGMGGCGGGGNNKMFNWMMGLGLGSMALGGIMSLFGKGGQGKAPSLENSKFETTVNQQQAQALLDQQIPDKNDKAKYTANADGTFTFKEGDRTGSGKTPGEARIAFLLSKNEDQEAEISALKETINELKAQIAAKNAAEADPVVDTTQQPPVATAAKPAAASPSVPHTRVKLDVAAKYDDAKFEKISDLVKKIISDNKWNIHTTNDISDFTEKLVKLNPSVFKDGKIRENADWSKLDIPSDNDNYGKDDPLMQHMKSSSTSQSWFLDSGWTNREYDINTTTNGNQTSKKTDASNQSYDKLFPGRQPYL